MKIGIAEEVPSSWEFSVLERIVEVNPKLDKTQFEDDLDVSFVPMPAVEAESGKIDVSKSRKFSNVKKGYTAFQEKDVLFAKITPCTENGKMAVVPSVKNGLGFGSTEFHVLRSYSGISPQYVYYYVSSKLFRIEAEHNMTGAVGQRRVPAPWLSAVEIPLPPSNEQHRIVAKIEELFSELDKGIESLKTAREQLKVYRQALLKHAFEGKLTEQWRKDNADKLETADQLLERIKQEREARYQQQLEEWKVAVKQWEADGKEGKRPTRISKPKHLPDDEIETYSQLPTDWHWTSFCNVTYKIGDIDHKMPKDSDEGYPYLSTGNLRPDGIIDFLNAKIISKEDYQRLALKIKPENGDIIFPRYGTIGRNFLVDFDKEFLVSYSCAIVKNIASLMNQRYVYYYSLSPVVKKEIKKHVKETTQANIGIASIEKFVFPLCSYAEQCAIVEIIESALSVMDDFEASIEDQLNKSETLRQSILKKAFSGQLVPQDPDDEPAFVLLERIAKEKEEAAAKAKPAKAAKKKPKKNKTSTRKAS